MPAPYPDQQKRAREQLSWAFRNAANSRIIHYSCESFDDRPDGRSPRITSIAIRRLDSSDTASFSIHRVAEEEGVALIQIEAHYDRLERKMLELFYHYVATAGEVTFIHWNMRDANYGFEAIEHRYEVLGVLPVRIPSNRRLDLSPLLLDIYGSAYVEHPRLMNLATKNEITMLRALTGEEEAAAFTRKDYVALHQSTLRKVDMLHSIAERAFRGTLRTNASWWTLHGGRLRWAWEWIVANPTVIFTATMVGLFLAGVSIWLAYHPPTPNVSSH